DPEHSSFDVKVQVASLETGNPGMNDAAKATDMLDAAKFPEIHFLSTQVTRNLSGYHALGKLEMHGIQKEIDIPFSFRDHTFKGMFTVACSAYGMKGAGKGASDSVTINLTVPVKE
ncbi:MAG TPA: YceI family protein, partial [Bacteroidia bacterium]|nr:YceI family protein [Bacteroidia bacterium]